MSVLSIVESLDLESVLFSCLLINQSIDVALKNNAFPRSSYRLHPDIAKLLILLSSWSMLVTPHLKVSSEN